MHRDGQGNPRLLTAGGDRANCFQDPFCALYPQTIGSKEALLKALERVRRRGYAIDDQEIEVGLRCVGAPIFDERHQAIAAVSVSGPTTRITAPNMPEIAEHLLRCCRDITPSLGMHAKKRPRVLSAFERHYHA